MTQVVRMGVLRSFLLSMLVISGADGCFSTFECSNIQSCCQYCRSEPKHWVNIGGEHQLNKDIAVTKMNDPPAYLVSDEEIVDFIHEDREYKLKYAGALIKLTHENLNDPDAVIANQYVQVDMAEPKFVGGVMTQGGFYEERLQGLIPYQESWVTQFALSYSNSSDQGYQLYKTETGIVQTFSGNSDAETSKLSSLVPPIMARFVRYHPLLGQNEDGALSEVSVRVTAVTCQTELCATTRINCLLTEWAEWSECECGAACSQSRTRSVRRVQSCGGSRCGALKETQSCVPPEPLWKSAIQYGGIALGVLLLIAVIGFVIYKKTHKDRVEVIVVKENDDDDNDRRKDRNTGPAMHPRPGAPPPMGFGPRGPSMPPTFTGFGPRPGFGGPGGPGGPGMRPRFPPPSMGGPPPPGPGMPNINN